MSVGDYDHVGNRPFIVSEAAALGDATRRAGRRYLDGHQGIYCMDCLGFRTPPHKNSCSPVNLTTDALSEGGVLICVISEISCSSYLLEFSFLFYAMCPNRLKLKWFILLQAQRDVSLTDVFSCLSDRRRETSWNQSDVVV